MIIEGPVILVRLPNWLGDTVMALPALAGLRASLPEARIALVGRFAPVLQGQAVADAVLSYPHGEGARSRLGAVLRDGRPDTAIVLPNSFESALAARRWGARVRLGYDADLRGWLLTHPLEQCSPRRHQIDEYRQLLEAGGVVSGSGAPAFALPDNRQAEEEVDVLFKGIGLAPEGGVVGLHLGASFGSSKLWPPAAYGELSCQLSRAGLLPVLLGAGGEEHTAASVVASAGEVIASLVGRDRLDLLPRLLARLTCLVSADTGVAHLAAAVGTPTVTLFGPTDPRLTSPRGRATRTLEGCAPCAPCFLERCPIDHPCMRSIEPAAVAGAVLTAVRDGHAA
ncbi:MAG TPA: lipopolysaccharide heptosyltransferase II [Methylomirabilota bacterium]|nr:lipopolysaccharide heptosyltransferase II [Methylomirabilota bacterium]